MRPDDVTAKVEEVFTENCKYKRTGKKRYFILGETLDGRLVFVIFLRLSGGIIRVIQKESGEKPGKVRLSIAVANQNSSKIKQGTPAETGPLDMLAKP